MANRLDHGMSLVSRKHLPNPNDGVGKAEEAKATAPTPATATAPAQLLIISNLKCTRSVQGEIGGEMTGLRVYPIISAFYGVNFLKPKPFFN